MTLSPIILNPISAVKLAHRACRCVSSIGMLIGALMLSFLMLSSLMLSSCCPGRLMMKNFGVVSAEIDVEVSCGIWLPPSI